MGLKRKQMLMQQKAYFEHKLQDRLSFLSGKGIKSPKAAKQRGQGPRPAPPNLTPLSGRKWRLK
jgi:hypothetical protein